jgi:LPXTG-motif cell wall-anchored protein
VYSALKKSISVGIGSVAVLYFLFGASGGAVAQGDQARVRAVHASPDGPAVDILVDDNAAFRNVAFKGISDYAGLDAGSHNVKVVPAGDTEPAVIDADLDLAASQDYTVVAVGTLDAIEPLVLEDSNSAPAAGMAHVRFVHASPDAPTVDVAVKNGPSLFTNVAYKEVGDYTPVESGSYDLEVRIAGTEDVALDVPGVSLDGGAVYTVFAVGLADGEPALSALLSLDAQHDAAQAAGDSDMPETLPKTGANDSLAYLIAGGVAIMGAGLLLRRREAQAVRIRR